MDAGLSSFALVALISIALIFDALNGLHDAANSIATIVSTRVLRPQYAVAWAAFFNFVAFLFFGLSVAQTIGTGISRLVGQVNLGGQSIPSIVAPESIMLAFSVSAAVGLFFGIYPAMRASRLNPIEALRYE